MRACVWCLDGLRALSPQREWQPSRWLEPDMPASRGITHWHAEGLPYMRHARTEPGGSVTRGFGNAQVLDRALRLPGTSQLVHSARETPLWVMTSDLSEAPAATKLGAAGAQVMRVATTTAPPPGLALPAVLHALADKGITRLMVEGGARVASSFVAADLADEIWLLRGPGSIGADGIVALNALPLTTITQSPAYRVRATETLDQDTLTIYERA